MPTIRHLCYFPKTVSFLPLPLQWLSDKDKLADVMGVFWRVKRWQVNYPQFWTHTSVANTETDLVCKRNAYRFQAINQTINGFYVATLFTWPGYSLSVFTKQGEYYVSFDLVGGPINWIPKSIRKGSDPFSYVVQTTGVRQDGLTSDIDIVISPSEYWEYDPGDGGGPIYDSATGAQLRPFP